MLKYTSNTPDEMSYLLSRIINIRYCECEMELQCVCLCNSLQDIRSRCRIGF